MSEQELFNVPDSRGIIQVLEPGPDGTMTMALLFPVPLAVLSLVAPNQTLGLTMRELADAAPEVQTHVIGAWFRANYQPRAVDDPLRYSANPIHQVSELLGFIFNDQRTGRVFSGGPALAVELQEEAFTWVEKPAEPRQFRRQNALDALDELEAAILRGGPGLPGRDHNQPPGPLDDKHPTLNDGRREALVAIEDSRRELHAERPNFDVLRRNAQTIIRLARMAGGVMGQAGRLTGRLVVAAGMAYATGIGALAATKGPDAAAANVAALWGMSVKAAMALQAFVGGP